MQNTPDINNLRFEIDRIHFDILKLIHERVLVTEKIWQLKKQNQLPMTDSIREKNLIHLYDDSEYLQNHTEFKELYHNVIRNLILENKNYLEKLNKNEA